MEKGLSLPCLRYRLEPSVKSQVVAVEPTYLFAFCIICDAIIAYHIP